MKICQPRSGTLEALRRPKALTADLESRTRRGGLSSSSSFSVHVLRSNSSRMTHKPPGTAKHSSNNADKDMVSMTSAKNNLRTSTQTAMKTCQPRNGTPEALRWPKALTADLESLKTKRAFQQLKLLSAHAQIELLEDDTQASRIPQALQR